MGTGGPPREYPGADGDSVGQEPRLLLPSVVVCSEAAPGTASGIALSGIVPSGIALSGIVPSGIVISKADALLEGAPEAVPATASEP